MHPFEHDFFDQISRSFPSLNHLTVFNTIEQNEKQTRESSDYEQTSVIPEFLYLSDADYAEQFLLDTNTNLPSSIRRLDYSIYQLKISFIAFTQRSFIHN
jgi:hypothetical protein